MNARHLYVHVPFCARRCSYCDFSIAVRRETPVAEYLDALAREVSLVGLPADLATIYLGGGTPSRLGGAGIARLATLLGGRRDLAEFTIEANPEDITAEAVTAWLAAGVNRISLGAQSFDQAVLRWMHRVHDAGAIGRAVQVARAAGAGNISLDLIFSLPESLGRNWRRDLEQAIALEPDHISLYGLTIEEGTPLGRQVQRGEMSAAPDTRYEDDYLLAHERLGQAGYEFYEVSNAARPGREAVHNHAYWRLVPYLGIGPSAHSFDGATRWWNEAAYAKWRERLAAGASPVAGREILSAPQQAVEQLYLGLRTAEGIALDHPAAVRLSKVAAQWIAQGWAEQFGAGRLRLSTLGWLRLDKLVASV